MKSDYTHHWTVALLCVAFTAELYAQTTAFTYQGELTEDGAPAAGLYDLSFELLDAETNGVSHGALTNAATAVSGGVFSVTLDFGSSAFDGTELWLEVGVRTNGGSGFTTLWPRTELTPTPYALYAPTAGAASTAESAAEVTGPVAASQIEGTIPSANIGTGTITSEKIAAGTIAEDDLSPTLASNTFWRLDGNAGTTEGTEFLGTTDSRPLDVRVNNVPGLRLEYPTAGTVPNLVGGYLDNSVGSETEGAVIAGGGALGNQNTVGANSDYGAIGGGFSNHVDAESGGTIIAGGSFNDIGVGSPYSAIGGGWENRIASGSWYAAIAGGVLNDIGTNSASGTVSGGWDNNIAPNSSAATIAGGVENGIGAAAPQSAIGGGYGNNIASKARHATIAGGEINDVGVGSSHGTIGGGYDNNIASTSRLATIAGGEINDIGMGSAHATIGGGYDNSITSFSGWATIAGGVRNNIGMNSIFGTIGGGIDSTIASNSSHTTIAGGHGNDIGVDSDWSAVGGGYDNNIGDNAQYATIPGGSLNEAGEDAWYAFAAGHRAKADHTGSFVWADSTGADFTSVSDNEFAVRASGGARFEGGPIQAVGGLVIENRTNDPPSPVTGQMWLRTDL